MFSYIKRIEGKSREGRRQEIKNILNELSVPFSIQRFWHTYLLKNGENIIVDFLSKENDESKKIVVCAHYDAWGQSPGANDNASAIVVMMALIERLRHTEIHKYALRFAFFDFEESLFLYHAGSLKYIAEYGLHNVDRIYNLELVGAGNAFLLWPVKDAQLKEDYIADVLKIIQSSNFEFKVSNSIPFYLTSEHKSFLKRGFQRVCTITTFHKEDFVFEEIMEKRPLRFLFSVLYQHLTGRGNVPAILKRYHNEFDRSEFVQATTLQNIFLVLWQTIQTLTR